MPTTGFLRPEKQSCCKQIRVAGIGRDKMLQIQNRLHWKVSWEQV